MMHCYINLMLGKRDSLYYFVPFAYIYVYIYICRSNNYYETFANNISLDRLKTKIPFLLSTF